MNEFTLITTVGLCLDIIGALILVGIIRHSRYTINRFIRTVQNIINELKNSSHYEDATPETNRQKIDKLQTDFYERQMEEVKELSKLGFGIMFLVLGFILQIIGNWLQNPPF